MKNYGTNLWHLGKSAEEFGVINQKGLSRKVRSVLRCGSQLRLTACMLSQHIFDAVQASLKRLQVDYIDLLQCAYPEDALCCSRR